MIKQCFCPRRTCKQLQSRFGQGLCLLKTYFVAAGVTPEMCGYVLITTQRIRPSGCVQSATQRIRPSGYVQSTTQRIRPSGYMQSTTRRLRPSGHVQRTTDRI